MKKLLILFFILLFTLNCAAIPDPPEVSADAAVVYNVEYDRILYEKNTEETIFPASLTKIMSAVLVLEHENNGELVEVTHSAIDGLKGNYIGLKAGEHVPYDDLVKALIISGANDAALVLAEYIGGTVDGFVDMMNAKAKELGMTRTHFTNPTGMHNDFMQTTLSDMLILCKYAYHINDFMEISSMPKYDMPKTDKSSMRTLITRNLMLSKIFGGDYYTDGIKGMNSGSTTEAGFCLATTKENKGLVYLCIVCGSEKDTTDKILSYSDTNSLYKHIFDNYDLIEVLSESSSVCEIPVRFSGTLDSTVVVAGRTLKTILPKDTDVKRQVTVEVDITKETVDAPVRAGTPVGTADIFLSGEKLGTVTVVTQASIERSNFLYLLFRVGEFFKSKPVVLTFLGIAATFIIYLIIAILAMPTKKRK